MRLLVLGGTRFVGRHVVEAALAREHQVTLFHRGNTGRELFPDIERRLGDRLGDVDQLRQGEWDAVIDVSAYVPRAVIQVTDALQGRVNHWVFVSTISVYMSSPDPVNEESPVRTLEAPFTEEITPESYGGLKVLCEQAVRQTSHGASIVRPTYIIGPYDHTNRFHKWVDWVASGAPIVIPRRTEQSTPVQWIDGRDLAEFLLECAESKWCGIANACCDPHSLERLAAQIADVTGRQLDLSFAEGEVDPMPPLCAPPSGEVDGLMSASNATATRAGLKIRPVAETIEAVARELGVI